LREKTRFVERTSAPLKDASCDNLLNRKSPPKAKEGGHSSKVEKGGFFVVEKGEGKILPTKKGTVLEAGRKDSLHLGERPPLS